MFFDAIVRDDRSLVDLLDADYTFVDERLARHYGIPNVNGSYFRRVSLAADSPRRGLLGQGSMLTVTSIADAHLAGLARQVGSGESARHAAAAFRRPASRRTWAGRGSGQDQRRCAQRLEAHRANPVCASCHQIMDPMGFALENFDLVGALARVRRPDADRLDRASSPTARRSAGPADLRQAVLSRSDAFVTTADREAVTYALGRPVHDYDMPTVRAIVRRAARTTTGSRRWSWASSRATRSRSA